MSIAFRRLHLLARTSSYAAAALPAMRYSTRADKDFLAAEGEEEVVRTSGFRRPLSETLRDLSQKVPDSFVKIRVENDGSHIRYIPWHITNRIMNVHAREWSGEVRNITYSPDAKVVSVVYRVTLHGTDDAKIYRESTGTASMHDLNYGDPVQKAEAMAFRRACARLGLGLHLYHEEL